MRAAASQSQQPSRSQSKVAASKHNSGALAVKLSLSF
jgi:hypothetical protein